MVRLSLGILILAIAALLAGCASAGDDRFLLASLDGEAKAAALADRGAAIYNEYVARDAAYGRLEEVREYFAVALRFDPSNAKAAQYLAKIDNFRAEFVRSNLKSARALEAKPKRTQDEDYRMVVAIQAAASADPQSEEAAALARRYAKLRSGLADYFAAQSEAAAKKAQSATGTAREDALAESYIAAKRAAAVDPSDDSLGRRDKALAAIKEVVAAYASSSAKLAAKSSFEAAERDASRIAALDRKAEGAFIGLLASATHDLNLAWAKSYESRQRYAEAAAKADKAIAAERSAEAVALRKRIGDKALALKKKTDQQKAAASAAATAAASAASASAGFDAALAEVDRLIAAGDVVGAKEGIDAAAALTKETPKLDALDERRARIRSMIAKLYAEGVAAYRSEDFKSAVDLLQAVVRVDADYEQASDFFAKAKEKQRLVDQYSK